MLIRPEIACAIIEGISDVREDEQLQDFVVEVEGTEFKCHRLILSACSGFFRGLLRSKMKESQKQRTKLEGVSKQTFAAILETLYTGSDYLTRGNMLEVWLAADQLQIKVVLDNVTLFIEKNICEESVISVWEVASLLMHKSIIQLCVNFLGKNISPQNWEIVHSIANTLGQEWILPLMLNYIKTNFEEVIQYKTFIHLRENDLLEIIGSQDLVVSSEDVIVESVFKWINGDIKYNFDRPAGVLSQSESCVRVSEVQDGVKKQHILPTGQCQFSGDHDEVGGGAKPECLKEDRERVKCLESLLLETRLCLVSSITLEKLSRDTLVMDNKQAGDMVAKAVLYKSLRHQHGQWPKAAIHRSCSSLENVGVMGSSNGEFFAIRFLYNAYTYGLSTDHEKIPNCPMEKCTSVNLIAYGTDFFAVGDLDLEERKSTLSGFVQHEWRHIKTLVGTGWLGVAVEEFIYLINSCNGKVTRFVPGLGNCLFEKCIRFPSRDTIDHVCSLDLYIIVFCSVITQGEDKAAIHCLNTVSQTWTVLDNIEGSTKNMVSFKREEQLFFLLTNGKVWEINHDECKGVHIKYVEVLWRGHFKLYGAICFYEDCIYFYGEKYSLHNTAPVLRTIFPKFTLVGAPDPRSNIVKGILNKSMCKLYKYTLG